MTINHCPDAKRGCTESFEAHLLKAQGFAYTRGGLPRQRIAPGFSPEECHLGQWLRSVIAKRRVQSRTLTEEQSWLVHMLMTDHPQQWERRESGELDAPDTDEERLLAILGYLQAHIRLPRLFRPDGTREEEIAGNALSEFRTRIRGTRLNGRQDLDERTVAMLEYLCPEWRGPRALDPKRIIVKRPRRAA
ncbi:hypothetical protein [Pseudoclavibacter sp. VKM Ac-2867]|uniref:hypothetical protein n=1 Tax=Pseudoclavibacter sp. VKM Ac-2867 TaxID=2783829 RepID=UPI00188B3EDA|nr:hypothetical protein [Pseudoclavibacter sp. VKM Ac-2867]MBF4459395.1 hypothetical protein [Pseudoclavibacter sp. VKM Ac-2867]